MCIPSLTAQFSHVTELPDLTGILNIFTPRTIVANSAINSLPRSDITCVGQGYQVNHACSTILAMVSALLFGISLISNHPVAGSIIAIHHNVKGLELLFFMVYGPIRLTQSFSHGSAFASLGSKCPYFFFCHFAIWQVGHFEQTSCTCRLRCFQ